MSTVDKFTEDLSRLLELGKSLYARLVIDNYDEITKSQKKDFEKLASKNFKKDYEQWYTEACELIKQIIPDRLNDFVSYYKNEKRKIIDVSSYTLSDYLLGIEMTRGAEKIVSKSTAIPKFEIQRNILSSVQQRFASKLFDIKNILQADLFSNELETAEVLNKNGFIRAAGAIAGVVLEAHLKQICNNHNYKIVKKNPCINDFNEHLKKEELIDIPQWRFIQRLGDLRNLCDHKKEKEPTQDDVVELIKGVDKITKTIF